jgi:hypothetical protein
VSNQICGDILFLHHQRNQFNPPPYGIEADIPGETNISKVQIVGVYQDTTLRSICECFCGVTSIQYHTLDLLITTFPVVQSSSMVEK